MTKPTEKDVQRYHDMLAAIVTGQIDLETVATNKKEMQQGLYEMGCYLRVLCWMLRHEHNDTFKKQMALTELMLKEMGVEEVESPIHFTKDRFPRQG